MKFTIKEKRTSIYEVSFKDKRRKPMLIEACNKKDAITSISCIYKGAFWIDEK